MKRFLCLGVEPGLEMKGYEYLSDQRQRKGRSMVEMRELKREVKWVHLYVRLHI